MNEREEKELLEIKEQIQQSYETIDLSNVEDLFLARRLLRLAESGLKEKYLSRCIEIELENQKKGLDIFKRLKVFDDYLKIAPSQYFRNGVKAIV